MVVAVVAGILTLGALGEFTRKARVNGFLAPREGLVTVVPPAAGVLTRVHVTEGARVEAGDPLAVLSIDVASRAGATGASIVDSLSARRESFEAERERQSGLADLEAKALRANIEALSAEDGDLGGELDLQRQRIALAERELDRQRSLRARGITTEPELREAEAELLSQQIGMQTLERTRATLRRERLTAEAALAEAPLRTALAIATIERSIAELDEALAQAEAAREIVIAAPQAGLVSGLQAPPGGSVGPDRALLTLVPAGATMEARLYGPSRAIGFVREGQRVQIRYAAYPFQKFGQQEGRVRGVSLATVGASELAERAGPLSGVEPGEPVYRITVDLARQSVLAYGEPMPLQAGMTLEADVELDRRRLYEWVLDPLYALAARSR